MSHTVTLKPGHKAIQTYYAALKRYSDERVLHEGALETAFSNLLAETGRTRRWTLIPKLPHKLNGKSVIPDGTLRDEYNLKRGFWEAKDTHDDLDDEISKKIDKGYPLSNTIFEDTREAVLCLVGSERNRLDLSKYQDQMDLGKAFYDIDPAAHNGSMEPGNEL